MTTALDIDVATLVGDMPAVPCESAGHSHQPEFHDGPATHYARVRCITCGRSILKSYCSKFTAYIESGGAAACADCFTLTSDIELLSITILGPVNA